MGLHRRAEKKTPVWGSFSFREEGFFSPEVFLGADLAREIEFPELFDALMGNVSLMTAVHR